VNLKFAEIAWNSIGQRIFSVALNGNVVLPNFDIVAAAGGPLTPVDEAFPVTVTNGQIQVGFLQGAAGSPEINAIEIVQQGSPLSATATAPPTVFNPVYINAGGSAYQDTLGNNWLGDIDYTGGLIWSTTHSISNTTDPKLYQNSRYGETYYQIPVPNGKYSVTLKFAEISVSGAGQRLFNVEINGVPVLTKFDIIAAIGGPYIGLDKTFIVTVTNGALIVGFTPGVVNKPSINAIEVILSN
jgi:hypothetical protein